MAHVTVVLVFLLLTLNIFGIFFSVSIVVFEHANVSWVRNNLTSHKSIRFGRQLLFLGIAFKYPFFFLHLTMKLSQELQVQR